MLRSDCWRILSCLFALSISVVDGRASFVVSPRQNILLQRGGGAETTNTEILRIRLPDGSIQRVPLTEEVRGSSVSTVLKRLGSDFSQQTLDMDGTTVQPSLLISELPHLRHGSLLTIPPPSGNKKQKKTSSKDDTKSFIPFPDLHKKWNDKRFTARKKVATSYAALSDYREATLHRVDEGSNVPRIQRLDICEHVAGRFVSSHTTSQQTVLLGTIAEQYDTKATHSLNDHQRPKKTVVAKVQALVNVDSDDTTWKWVAKHLGLTVIGWMVRSSLSHDTALVPTANQIVQAANLQIDIMQHDTSSKTKFQGFCTIVMHPETGATEAYQLSDVTVQMASEGLFMAASNDEIIPTCHPILIEGKETKELDTVLTLVNTAVVSHTGRYCRKKPSVKSNGRVSKNTKSKLLKALEQQSEDTAAALEILADFELLVALCRRLKQPEGKELCETVRAYAKGRTKTTVLDSVLRKRLLQVLSAD